MPSTFKDKKVQRKQRRCEILIQNEHNIESSEDPTRFIGILNAGLSTGLTAECLLAEATIHGKVTQLLMLPHKSYCFLECCTTADAELIFQAMHGISAIGQKEAVAYLSFFKQLPAIKSELIWCNAQQTPPGLILLPEFITATEEHELLQAVGVEKEVEKVTTDVLKNRRVRHFGYEFLYGINNVNPEKPMDQKIPTECDKLWPLLQQVLEGENIQLSWSKPEQLTVNEYEPGQGIPPHIDTHSAFLDPIFSLSLESDVVMEFRKGTERIPVLLPRRSLLIMSGEARYAWTHGITPRTMDVVQSNNGSLTTQARRKRTSLTFRSLRRAPCDCAFPAVCDSQREASESSEGVKVIEESEASCLEAQNVHTVYDQIALHFSETRHKPWPRVAGFLIGFPLGSVVLDVGCGNGKYLNCNPKILTIGCDRSHSLLEVCACVNKQLVFRCDCLQLPIRTQSVDGCISIAVIHHLSTTTRRLAAVREMARVLRKGGRALIYVWAKNQRKDAKKSSYLLQNKAVNKHKTTEAQQRQITAHEEFVVNDESAIAPVPLPIHTNRTDFLQQDVLVPWKLKSNQMTNATNNTPTFLRYYHVFEDDELQELVKQIAEVKLVETYYDQGNHCVIFEKL